ncbi:hypothetical protein BP742P1_00024 [Bifidobacterium phage BP742P1]|nr:hypothetical protein BP742P1_00024 [Bifidobacterium phage BP742P1]
MWIIGDWGQSKPWQRSSGVKMTKGEDGVYTGVLTLPKGTGFDLKILESTVDGTSGGENAWSAVRYASVLNSDGTYDFGEFVDNLVPNGSFEEEGTVKWTPAQCVTTRNRSYEGGKCLAIGDTFPTGAYSDAFVIPPNQDLRLSLFMHSGLTPPQVASIEIKDVNTQSVLFETSLQTSTGAWEAFSSTFKTGNSPVTAQIVCSIIGHYAIDIDSMSLATP